MELVGDVSDEEVVRAGLERVIDRFGTLHVVVNNAGVYPSKPFEETTAEEWRRVLRRLEDGPDRLHPRTRRRARPVRDHRQRHRAHHGPHRHRRTQEPADLVSTLLYVVDEGSGFLTGQTLNVSGGSAYL